MGFGIPVRSMFTFSSSSWKALSSFLFFHGCGNWIYFYILRMKPRLYYKFQKLKVFLFLAIDEPKLKLKIQS